MHQTFQGIPANIIVHTVVAVEPRSISKDQVWIHIRMAQGQAESSQASRRQQLRPWDQGGGWGRLKGELAGPGCPAAHHLSEPSTLSYLNHFPLRFLKIQLNIFTSVVSCSSFA